VADLNTYVAPPEQNKIRRRLLDYRCLTQSATDRPSDIGDHSACSQRRRPHPVVAVQRGMSAGDKPGNACTRGMSATAIPLGLLARSCIPGCPPGTISSELRCNEPLSVKWRLIAMDEQPGALCSGRTPHITVATHRMRTTDPGLTLLFARRAQAAWYPPKRRRLQATMAATVSAHHSDVQ
jgi:hypothetical protein